MIAWFFDQFAPLGLFVIGVTCLYFFAALVSFTDDP